MARKIVITAAVVVFGIGCVAGRADRERHSNRTGFAADGFAQTAAMLAAPSAAARARMQPSIVRY